MFKKITSIIMMVIIVIPVVGCSKEDNKNSENNTQQESFVGDGSQRRGGQAKLDRMKSGEGGRKRLQ